MTKLTISVKEGKLIQLINYLNKLDYVKVDEPLPPIYSNHKKIVDEELQYLEKKGSKTVSLKEFKKNAKKHLK